MWISRIFEVFTRLLLGAQDGRGTADVCGTFTEDNYCDACGGAGVHESRWFVHSVTKTNQSCTEGIQRCRIAHQCQAACSEIQYFFMYQTDCCKLNKTAESQSPHTQLSFSNNWLSNVFFAEFYWKSTDFNEVYIKITIYQQLQSNLRREYSGICLKALFYCRGTPQFSFLWSNKHISKNWDVVIFRKVSFHPNSIFGSLICRAIS